ncbi:MAG: GNAT family N-acetyltransferase [Candidatus Bathyarchaeota archaeon]|nr:MAG: GNAT family N-acetyltransferase [Candidatus Bathyarchaeota archaeon]
MRVIVKAVVKGITQENLKDIPEPCRSCLYWEFPEDSEKTKLSKSELVRKKKSWFLKTLREFGNCGSLVYYDNDVIGYAQYAPATCLSNVGSYESKLIGQLEDGTVFLSCLYVGEKTFRGRGIGTKLLESIISDLKKRGFKAVETFARSGSSNNPSGPIELYLEKGFRIKEETTSGFPLARLEL